MSHEATAAAAGNAAAAAAAAVLQRGNAQPSAETMEQVCSASVILLGLAFRGMLHGYILQGDGGH